MPKNTKRSKKIRSKKSKKSNRTTFSQTQNQSILRGGLFQNYSSTIHGGQSTKFLENVSFKNVQQYFGHGGLECVNDSLVLQKIPSNIALLTSAKCGHLVYGGAQYHMETIQSISPALIQALLERKPYDSSEFIMKRLQKTEKFTNEQLQKDYSIIGMPEKRRNILSSLPGDTQTSTFYQPTISDRQDGFPQYIGLCGMYSLDYLYERISDPRLVAKFQMRMSSFGLPKNNFYFSIFFADCFEEKMTVRDALFFKYGHALYPKFSDIETYIQYIMNEFPQFFPKLSSKIDSFLNPENINSLLLIDNLIERKFTIRLQSLFQEFYGVHVFNLCRSQDSSCKAPRFKEEYFG